MHVVRGMQWSTMAESNLSGLHWLVLYIVLNLVCIIRAQCCFAKDLIVILICISAAYCTHIKTKRWSCSLWSIDALPKSDLWIWYACTLHQQGVTLMNRSGFQSYKWPYPSSLALWHYTCTSIGSIFLVRVMRVTTPAKLKRDEHLKMLAFSCLFNVNIWFSNYSLNLVSMAMHQMIRALVPACTVVISFFWLRKRYVFNAFDFKHSHTWIPVSCSILCQLIFWLSRFTPLHRYSSNVLASLGVIFLGVCIYSYKV